MSGDHNANQTDHDDIDVAALISDLHAAYLAGFVSGREEMRAKCAALCEIEGAGMAWPLAKIIKELK